MTIAIVKFGRTGRHWFGRIGSAVLGVGLAIATAGAALAGTPVQKVTSAGGLEAWLIESHNIELISMRFTFEGGALAEPRDKEGVARMVAFMFNEGAADMNTEQLSRKRLSLGINMAGFSDHTAVGVTFTTPSAYRAEGLKLLRQALHQPRYDAEPIERGRRSYEAELTAELQAPGSIAADQIGRRQFGDGRLSRSVSGTLDSMKRITRDDIEAFRRRTFARGNIKIAVAGDITPGELAPLLDDLFGGLPATAVVAPNPPMVPQTASADFTRMEIPQTIVMFGNTAPKLSWRQSMAFGIGNQILSGDFSSRLVSQIREKRGLVYGIQASRYDLAETSVFYTAFGAGGDNARQALEESRREIERFVVEGVTEEEVATAKSAFLGGFLLGLDTNDKLVAQLLSMRRNDLPITFLDDYAGEIERIAVADVMAAVRLAIRPEVMNIAAVGNPPADFDLGPLASAR